jgi:hypothetical protein
MSQSGRSFAIKLGMIPRDAKALAQRSRITSSRSPSQDDP